MIIWVRSLRSCNIPVGGQPAAEHLVPFPVVFHTLLELMITRVPQVLLMLPIQIIVLRLIGSKRLVTALAGTAV